MTKKIYRELRREFPFAEIVPTKGGHVCLRLPNGHQVFTSVTPGDWRAAHNLRAEVRRRMFFNRTNNQPTGE